MISLPIQVLSIVTNLAILIIAGYYLLKLRARDKKLSRKEGKIDSSYRKIVIDALEKEKEILGNATEEADKIILDTEIIKESTQNAVNQALKIMVEEIQKESIATATNFMDNYSSSLKELSTSSLTDFQNVAKGLEGDLQKQIKDFRENLLPDMEREFSEYKKSRMKQAEETISEIIQKASQEIFNKSISLEDHHKLLIDSLEKARIEGVLN
jgi:hypothetical protein